MKVFTYTYNTLACVILAFNKGHAVKQLAKELKERKFDIDLDEHGTIEEIDPEDPKFKKGNVFFLTWE